MKSKDVYKRQAKRWCRSENQSTSRGQSAAVAEGKLIFGSIHIDIQQNQHRGIQMCIRDRVYAVYYSKNNTIYYNTNFDSNAPKIIVKK